MNKAILAKRVRDPRSGEVHSPSCSPSAQVGQFIAIEEERFFGSS